MFTNGSIASNIVFLLQSNNQQHGNSCMHIVKCCKTSNPCLNGGTCLLPSPSSKKRFTCKCIEGYKGERCEDMCEPIGTGADVGTFETESGMGEDNLGLC